MKRTDHDPAPDVPGFLRGVIAFPHTPISPAGHINVEKFTNHLEMLLAAGVHGIAPAGSTGEFAYLDEAARRQLVELTIKTVAGRVPVTVMTTAHTTAEVVRHARHAAQAGADAQLLNAHSYFPLTNQEVYQHVAAAAAAAPDLPLVVYNSPTVTGFRFTVDMIEQLSTIPQLVAVKEGSADLNLAGRIIRSCGDRVAVLVGHEAFALRLFAIGAVGWMSAMANLTPHACVALYEAATTGDWPRARALHAALERLANFLQDRHLPVVVKAILERTGAGAGEPVPPLLPLGAGDAERAVAVYEAAVADASAHLDPPSTPRHPAASPTSQGVLP